MKWKIIETWRSDQKEAQMFSIKSKDGGTEKICGVTDNTGEQLENKITMRFAAAVEPENIGNIIKELKNTD